MSNTDELLAGILDDLLEQARRGQTPDLEAVVREHADLAAELRELWATAMIAEDLGSLSGTPREEFRAEVFEVRITAGLPREFGDYLLLEEIGRGGMGVVYRARQQSLGRTVALKMILRGELATPADIARFRAEAEAAARLQHPNIVPIYEVGEVEEQPYFSMKYIEGTTLARRLAEGPLPPRMAAELLAPVCRAIDDAHARGVLHRDLKPSNILISHEGIPYVSDFGLAKQFVTGADAAERATSLTLSGAVVGTPGYMAPEQAAGKRGSVSPATDIYSLGAILYAMLTGRPPFQAASPVDTVLMVLEQDPAPPGVLNPRADPDLEMIALKCLQKPADLRYGDAGLLAEDLEAFLANEPISARSGRFLQIVSRTFRETHHAAVLENWGLLWVWHSLVLLVLSVITNAMQWQGITSRPPYLALWTVGLGAWAMIFWSLRRRSGPTTFVERQIAHIWAGSMICSTLLYVVEWLLDLPVLTLSPVLALVAGVVFLAKAGILSGAFYAQSAALFLTSLVMAVLRNGPGPDWGLTLFGIASALCFFVPGIKYHRQRIRAVVR